MIRSTIQSSAAFVRLIVIGVATASLVACERAKTETATPPAVTPLAVTSAQFQQLRWLEGRWHGSGGGVDNFFEGYRWVDDSTIRKYDFADSTFSAPTDSSEIRLRDGVARSGSSTTSWVVVALDSIEVKFAPERGASNAFSWRRNGASAWTARLTWDSAGIARERVYEMRAH